MRQRFSKDPIVLTTNLTIAAICLVASAGALIHYLTTGGMDNKVIYLVLGVALASMAAGPIVNRRADTAQPPDPDNRWFPFSRTLFVILIAQLALHCALIVTILLIGSAHFTGNIQDIPFTPNPIHWLAALAFTTALTPTTTFLTTLGAPNAFLTLHRRTSTIGVLGGSLGLGLVGIINLLIFF